MPAGSFPDDADLRKLDVGYKGFAPFAEWAATPVDAVRWDRYVAIMSERAKVSEDILRRARQVVTRAAAIDTGAIEGLYEVDRGFTFTVATETAIWEASLDAKGPHVRPMFEAALSAYEYVLDLATNRTPMTEMIVRTLHQELCRPQETYTVATAVGVQDQPLIKGQYKTAPNHVRGRDGAMHSYAPVDLTPAEMHRLMGELSSAEFAAAHPVLQAAYAHFAFVAIHPFADGNGRVARALASVYTYRAASVPFLVLFEHRHAYYEALAAADHNVLEPFVSFSLARVLDAITLVDESIRTALVPDPGAAAEDLQRLYVTKGGYSHIDVDLAGERFIDAVVAELNRIAPEYRTDHVTIQVSRHAGKLASPRIGFRYPTSRLPFFQIDVTADAPATASLDRTFQLELPIDCGVHDDLTLRNPETGETFTARFEDFRSAVSSIVQMRMNMFARRVFSNALVELKTRADAALRKNGY